jgi:hypothetical protein
LAAEDPLLRHSRREAVFSLALWLAATLWSAGYSYLFGYERPVESLSFVLGFPDWVFWGIVLPWLIATAVSIVFALGFMRDDPLGDECEAADGNESERGHGNGSGSADKTAGGGPHA